MTARTKSSLFYRLLKFTGRLVGGIVLAGLAVWCALAIYFSNLPAAWLRTLERIAPPLVVAFAAVVVARIVRLALP